MSAVHNAIDHDAAEASVQTFRFKAPSAYDRRKAIVKLTSNERGATAVHCLGQGGENNLHFHAGVDITWMVLKGRARFYGPSNDEVRGEFGPHEGLMIPAASATGTHCAFKLGNNDTFNGCFDELAGKKVSVAAGGTTNKNLTTHSQRMVAAGKQAIEVRAFDTNADAIQALVSGQVDAAYLNDPQAAFYITTSGNRYKMAFRGFASNQLALTTLKENTALADAFVWALERMRADGSYEAIMTKWGVASVPSFAYAK